MCLVYLLIHSSHGHINHHCDCCAIINDTIRIYCSCIYDNVKMIKVRDYELFYELSFLQNIYHIKTTVVLHHLFILCQGILLFQLDHLDVYVHVKLNNECIKFVLPDKMINQYVYVIFLVNRPLKTTSYLNPLTAILCNLNFHPLEVVSRWRDPQLQVNKK